MITGLIIMLLGALWVVLATTQWPGSREPLHGWVGWALVGFGLGLVVLSSPRAEAAPQAIRRAETVPTVRVPELSTMYRRWVEQAAAEEWGVDGSPARLAAQLHQESSWNPMARSPVGAEGLAQFMPATARWIAGKFPDKLGQFDPWDPQQAALAAAVYDAWLVKRNPGTTSCDSWAFGLSAYNGGETRLKREQTLAQRRGTDPRVWFGSVADQRARGPSAWRENRGYVRRILLVLEPSYIAAGWAGKAVCA